LYNTDTGRYALMGASELFVRCGTYKAQWFEIHTVCYIFCKWFFTFVTHIYRVAEHSQKLVKFMCMHIQFLDYKHFFYKCAGSGRQQDTSHMLNFLPEAHTSRILLNTRTHMALLIS